jgi:hypothetical protein
MHDYKKTLPGGSLFLKAQANKIISRYGVKRLRNPGEMFVKYSNKIILWCFTTPVRPVMVEEPGVSELAVGVPCGCGGRLAVGLGVPCVRVRGGPDLEQRAALVTPQPLLQRPHAAHAQETRQLGRGEA